MNIRLVKHFAIAAAMCAAYAGFSTPIASAANTWDGGGIDGKWSTLANWDNDALPALPGALTFSGTAQLSTNNDLVGPTTLTGITFDATAGAFSIGGNAFTLSAGTISTNSAATETINAAMTTTGTFTKAGTGTLVLSANESIGGTVVLNGGTLTLSPNASGNYTIPASGLQFGATVGSTLNVNENSTFASLTSGTNTAANTLSIASGKQLTLTGGMTVGFAAAAAAPSTLNIGAGSGSLVNNTTGSILTVGVVGTATDTANLNLSNLSNFTWNTGGGATGGEIRIAGSNTAGGSGNFSIGNLTLSSGSNNITVATLTVAGGASGTAGVNPPGIAGTLTLGPGTSNINVDNIFVGTFKAAGQIVWGTTPGSLTIRGSAGGTSRANSIVIGQDLNGQTGTSNSPVGTVNLNNAVGLDILANSLVLANRTASGASSATNGAVTGSLLFNSGTVDVSSVSMATRTNAGATVTNVGPATATLTVGGTGKLIVGTGGFSLATNTNTGTQNAVSPNVGATGTLTISGTGTVQSNSDIVATVSGNSGAAPGTPNTINATINLSGGTLDMMGHSIGINTVPQTPVNAPITTLTTTSGTLKSVGQILMNTQTNNPGNLTGVTKTGSGTLTLAGTNTYTGDTTIGVNGAAGGIVVVNGTTNLGTFTVNVGALSGTGSAGVTTLNNLTTDVNQNPILATSSILDPGGSAVSGLPSLDGQVGTLTLKQLNVQGGGGVLRFDLPVIPTVQNPTPAGNDYITVTDSASFSAPAKLSFPKLPASGTYTLVMLTNGTFNPTDIGNISTPTPTGVRPGFTVQPFFSADNKKLNLLVSGAGNLTWTGTGDANGTWDINTTQNWSNNGSTTVANDKFFNLDSVTFTDSPSAPAIRNINLTTQIQPGSVTVNNSIGNDFTITGSGGDISGSGGITKQGTGNLILATSNTYIGPTAINGGAIVLTGSMGSTSGITIGPSSTLQVGDGTATGNGANALGTTTFPDITNNGTLTFSRTDGTALAPVVFANNISGASGLTVDGNGGAVQLSGVNSYTGNTTISSGARLEPRDSNSLGAITGPTVGSVTVASGGTLDLENIAATPTVVNFGSKQFFISGNGSGGVNGGAILHAGINPAANAFQFITLQADATISAGQRINIVGGTLDLAGFKLTKTAGNSFGISNTVVTDGNIDVTVGRLELIGTTQILQTANNTSIQFEAGTVASFQTTTAGNITRSINFIGAGDQIGPGSNAVARVDSNISLQSDVTEKAINNNGTGTLNLAGNISGANLIKDVTTDGGVSPFTGDILMLSGSNNTFAGLTINNGVVQLGSVTGLNPSIPITFGAGDLAQPVLRLNGFSATIGNVIQPNPNGIIENNSAIPATVTIAGTGSTLNGVVQDGAAGGKLSLTWSGTGTLNLAGTNTYTGSTTVTGGGTLTVTGSATSSTFNIQNGTLQLGAGSFNTSIATNSSVTLGGAGTSGTLDLNGATVTVAGLAAGPTNGSNVIGSSSTNGFPTLNFIGGTSTFGGTIKDSIGGGNQPVVLNIGDDQSTTALTLTGPNTFTGGTTVKSHATLIVNGSLNNTGAVAINGGTLAGTGSMGNVTLGSGLIQPGNSGPGTMTMHSLSLNSGDVRYELPYADGDPNPAHIHDQIALVGTGVQLNFGGTTLTPANAGSLGVGTYTLITFPASTNVTGAPTLNVPDNTRANLKDPSHFKVNSTSLTLQVTIAPANLTWVGSANGAAWDVGGASTLNWSNNGSQSANDHFFNLDNVSFTDASANRNVSLNAAVSPGTLTVNNSAGHDYTFTGNGGRIESDGTTLVKQGTGKLTMLAQNTYTGGTSIADGGTIQLGAGTTPGDLGTGPIVGTGTGGTVLVAYQGFTQLNNSMSGPLNFAINPGNTNQVFLGGTNSYTGTTSIKSGTLQLMSAGAYASGSNLVLGDAGGTSGTLNLGGQTATVGNVSEAGGSANVINGGGTFVYAGSGTSTFTGTIQDNTNVTGHSGTLILTANNTYSGTTTTDAGGTLQFGNGGTTGKFGTGTAITSNGVVAFNHIDNLDFTTPSAIVISGSGGLTQMGPGNLKLGANTYSGPTVISGGVVQATVSASLGAVPGGSVTINPGGSLDFGTDTGATVAIGNTNPQQFTGTISFAAKPFLIAGSGVNNSGAIQNSNAAFQETANALQNVTLTADATINAAGRLDMRGGAPSLNLAGHTLTIIGGSQFSFFSGTVTDGNVDVQGNKTTFALESGATMGGNGTLTLENGTVLLVNGVAGGLSRPINVVGTANILLSNNNSTVGSPISVNGTLTFHNSTGPVLTISGNIGGPGSVQMNETLVTDGNPPVTNAAPPTVTLTGNNTYSGGTVLTAGVLVVGSDTALGSTAGGLTMNGITETAGTTTANGGTLNLNGHNVTVGAFGGGSATNNLGTITNSGASPVTFTFGSAAAPPAAFKGVIQNGTGTVSIVKNGSDSTILSGLNTYTGTTTINQGTLALGVAEGISSTTGVTLAGGKLATGGFTQTLNSAALNVAAPSKIDLGYQNTGDTLHFAASNTWSGSAGAAAGTLLRINNWKTIDHVTFPAGGITLAQAQLVHFTGIRGVGKLDGTGTEILPASDPTNAANLLLPGETNGVPGYTIADLDALFVALTNPTAFMANYPGGALSSYEFPDVADVNQDGFVDNGDIQAEIFAIQTGAPPAPPAPAAGLGGGSNLAAVPEPGSIVLLGLGGLIGLAQRVRSKKRRGN